MSDIPLQLNSDQKTALDGFVRDIRTARPQIQQTAVTAKRLFEEMVNADLWGIAEGPKPEDTPGQASWSVGHAKVNYVDHIERQTK